MWFISIYHIYIWVNRNQSSRNLKYADIASYDILFEVEHLTFSLIKSSTICHYFTQALEYCEEPNMIEELVRVLSKPELGKKQHVDKIRAIHERQKEQHKCSNCDR